LKSDRKKLEHQIEFMTKMLSEGWRIIQMTGLGSDVYNAEQNKISKDEYAVTIVFTKEKKK